MCKTFTVPSGAEVEIDDDNFITTEVVLDINDIIDHDFEWFLNMLSMGATNTALLTDAAYAPISLTPDFNLVFEVTGDISLILDCEADDGGS